MNQVTEARLEKRCVKYARDAGWLARKMNGLGFVSWCDRVFIPPPENTSAVLWVEFKRKGKTASEKQAAHHVDLRARGQRVHVVDDFEQFKTVLAEHLYD
jgi:hypothetical protein